MSSTGKRSTWLNSRPNSLTAFRTRAPSEALQFGGRTDLLWAVMETGEHSGRTVLMAEPLNDSHDFYVSWFAVEGTHAGLTFDTRPARSNLSPCVVPA